MVNVIESILTDEDINSYSALIKFGNLVHNPISPKNFYNRFVIDDDFFLNDLNKKLNSRNILNDTLKLSDVWVNKITTQTNQHDVFHYDESFATIIIYLNDNFIGGGFEFKDDMKTHKITPKKGLTLLLNSKVEHRVLPVTNGERYSLVIFINKKKTLL